MAPRRRGKKGSLHYALEVCDRGQLTAIISSRGDVDRSSGIEVMNCIRRAREVYRDNISPLQGAVSLGHYNICKHLVQEGAVLKSASNIPHPLCLALQKGHLEIAHLLLEAGADVNLSFGDAMPLSFALDDENCTVQIVKEIIEAGFPKDAIVHISTGRTALHSAVKMNHVAIVKYLCTLPVNPNVRDRKGLAPMHYAVQKGYPTIVKILANNGANVDCECLDNFTPMFYAIATGNCEMVQLLLTLGADIHYVNGSKTCSLMPLHFAANFCQLNVVKLLLQSGADVNRAVPLTGETALHAAARADTQNILHSKVSLDCIVELLIKAGAHLNVRHRFGLTPLQVAIKTKNVSIARLLIINGSDLNNGILENGDRCGTTLHLAAKCFDKELIRLCLEYGADYMAKDEEGLYPCNLAVLTAMLSLITHSSDCTKSLKGCQHSNEQLGVFRLFWRAGFPYDSILKMRWLNTETTPFPPKIINLVKVQRMLFTGTKCMNDKLVNKALAQGADVKCTASDVPFPLHFIAARGNELIMKIYLSRGVHVNTIDKNGETPLHIAAKEGFVNCCRLLLEYGASYNYSSSKCQKTPLQMAKDNGHSEVVTLLTTIAKYFRELKKGQFKKLKPKSKTFNAVMNCVDKTGKTLLATAVAYEMKGSADRLMKMRLRMTPSN